VTGKIDIFEFCKSGEKQVDNEANCDCCSGITTPRFKKDIISNAASGRGCDPMPSKVEFVDEGEGSRLVLVLSNKKDSYYVVTPAKCSCPAATYHPGQPCKHQRKHFPQVAMPVATAFESIRPECKWPGGLNGPVDKIPGEA